jgi:hypothetical protein
MIDLIERDSPLRVFVLSITTSDLVLRIVQGDTMRVKEFTSLDMTNENWLADTPELFTNYEKIV